MKYRIIFIFCFIHFYFWNSHAQTRIQTDSITIPKAPYLHFQKFIDRKLYVQTNPMPDECLVFLNGNKFPFRRSGKTISIFLPAYVDTIRKSFIQISSSVNHQKAKDYIIVLNYGKPAETFDSIIKIQKIPLRIPDPLLVVPAKPIIDQKLDTVIKQPAESNQYPEWISVYLDTYYALYNDMIGTNEFQKFNSISPRNNVIGLNTLQISLDYTKENIRGTATLHYGDFSKTSGSPDYKTILEAHAGLRLFNKVWIDAGFFRTHLGTEGLLPKENICSSAAIATFFEPTIISGLRINYLPDDKWNINFYLLNGFNGFVDNNKKKSAGLMIAYTFNKYVNVGYSNYLGDDTPDSLANIPHLRLHQNLFINLQLNRLKLQIGSDFCLQENSDLALPDQSAKMFSGMTTASYNLTKLLSLYSRYEFYQDPNGFMSVQFLDDNQKLTGCKLWGLTGGIELKPLEKMFIRLEGRRLQMQDSQKIFFRNGSHSNYRLECMINTGIIF